MRITIPIIRSLEELARQPLRTPHAREPAAFSRVAGAQARSVRIPAGEARRAGLVDEAAAPGSLADAAGVDGEVAGVLLDAGVAVWAAGGAVGAADFWEGGVLLEGDDELGVREEREEGESKDG